MLLKRGQDYLNRHDFREALLDFSDALQTNSPFKSELYYWRGVAHRALKEYPAAREDFKRAARLGNAAAKKALKEMPGGFFEALKSFWRMFSGNHQTGRHSRHW